MSTATSTLPPDWSHILDEMHMRLDHAITLADARIAQAPHFDAGAIGHERHQDVAKWSARLQRLSAYLESAQQVVHSVDQVLYREESLLRQKMAASETLRQKLADNTDRAIG